MQTIPLNKLTPLFVESFQQLDTDKLELYHEDKRLDITFEKVTEMLYRCKVKFNSIGVVVLRVLYDDVELYSTVVKVEVDYLDKLYNYQFGGWELKDNQMIFYDLDGSELMKFNLYDRNNNPAEFGVTKREVCS